MRLPRRVLFATVSLFAFTGVAQAQEVPRITVDARPSAVTVYPAQASVTRTGRVEIPAGDSLIVIAPVPTGIVADSITARGAASAPVTIGGVDIRQASFDPSVSNQRRAAIEAAMRPLDDQIAATDVRLAAWAAQTGLIGRLAAAFSEPPRPAAPGTTATAPRPADDPANWRQALDVTRMATEEAAEATRRIRQERREVEQRRAVLAAELATLGARPAGSLEIVVSVSAERATTLDLSVVYQVSSASWRPVYEARLDSQAGRIALRQEAVIAQRSGEDWTNVALTLSTARPAQGAQPPTLAPWRIALVDPAQLAREREIATRGLADGRAQQRMAPPQASAPTAPAAEPRQEAQIAGATVADAGLAVEYGIPGRASVRADGTDRRVRIAEDAAEAVLTARAVPRLDHRAYLQTRFTNPSRTPSLPGQASLYVDGVFNGRTALPMLRPEEEITLSFGADDRIRITYAPQTPRRANEGSLLTGRTQMRAVEALMTIRSYHTRPIEVTIQDQIPVSGETELVVTMTADPQPTARDIDDRPGVLAWTMTFAPQQERRIRFGYTITAPRDRMVGGMPR